MDEVGRIIEPIRQRLRAGQFIKERAEDGAGGTTGEDEQALGQPGTAVWAFVAWMVALTVVLLAAAAAFRRPTMS